MENNRTPSITKADLPTIRHKNTSSSAIKAELTIIGAGMAGLAAAVFATNRGISTVITGKRSSMNFATGLMDLMGVHPSGREWDNPWEAIELVRRDIPKHPYAAVKDEAIKESLSEMVEFLKAQGLFYRMQEHNNVNVITSLGTVKKSCLIPEPMWKGVAAFEQRSPTLIIDFTGMKIYSAKQIVSTLSDTWPQLQSARIDFPGMEKLEEVYPEHIARTLDIEENRIKLANLVKPLLDRGLFNICLPHGSYLPEKNLINDLPEKVAEKGLDKNGHTKFRYVGFPALLGMYKADEAIRQLEQLLGVPVFEIPTPPVSVPGIRLHEALTQGLAKRSNLIYEPEMVDSVEHLEDGTFRIRIANSLVENEVINQQDSYEKVKKTIESKAVILATGRFMGKGLIAKRTGIRESLFDLPVTQPAERKMWHHEDLFNPQGHPVNRAGIEIDTMMRPLSRSGKPLAPNLFAAGSILAHSDWTRMKCGSGVAVATAFTSVNYLEQILQKAT